MKLGSAMKRARTDAGLTQGRLAELCGLSQPEISRLEKGRQVPNAGKLCGWCFWTGADPRPLFETLLADEGGVMVQLESADAREALALILSVVSLCGPLQAGPHLDVVLSALRSACDRMVTP